MKVFHQETKNKLFKSFDYLDRAVIIVLVILSIHH